MRARITAVLTSSGGFPCTWVRASIEAKLRIMSNPKLTRAPSMTLTVTSSSERAGKALGSAR